jgi:hypothetical protein
VKNPFKRERSSSTPELDKFALNWEAAQEWAANRKKQEASIPPKTTLEQLAAEATTKERERNRNRPANTVYPHKYRRQWDMWDALTDPRVQIGGMAAFAIFGSFVPGMIADAGYGEEKAKGFAEDQGYSNVQVTDKDIFLPEWRGCGSSDVVGYDLEATSARGVQVELIVCKGILKGATLRQG